MRDAVGKLGGKAEMINPLSAVIDHSVQGRASARRTRSRRTTPMEFKPGAAARSCALSAFEKLHGCVPPNTGIVHQVSKSSEPRGVFERQDGEGIRSRIRHTRTAPIPHTTMINGLVFGSAVGGIEAEAACSASP